MKKFSIALVAFLCMASAAFAEYYRNFDLGSAKVGNTPNEVVIKAFPGKFQAPVTAAILKGKVVSGYVVEGNTFEYMAYKKAGKVKIMTSARLSTPGRHAAEFFEDIYVDKDWWRVTVIEECGNLALSRISAQQLVKREVAPKVTWTEVNVKTDQVIKKEEVKTVVAEMTKVQTKLVVNESLLKTLEPIKAPESQKALLRTTPIDWELTPGHVTYVEGNGHKARGHAEWLNGHIRYPISDSLFVGLGFDGSTGNGKIRYYEYSHTKWTVGPSLKLEPGTFSLDMYLGYGQVENHGKEVQANGTFRQHQTDELLRGILCLSDYKRRSMNKVWFPKTEYTLIGDLMLSRNNRSTFNGTPVSVKPWKNDFLQLDVKPSIYDIKKGGWVFTPEWVFSLGRNYGTVENYFKTGPSMTITKVRGNMYCDLVTIGIMNYQANFSHMTGPGNSWDVFKISVNLGNNYRAFKK